MIYIIFYLVKLFWPTYILILYFDFIYLIELLPLLNTYWILNSREMQSFPVHRPDFLYYRSEINDLKNKTKAKLYLVTSESFLCNRYFSGNKNPIERFETPQKAFGHDHLYFIGLLGYWAFTCKKTCKKRIEFFAMDGLKLWKKESGKLFITENHSHMGIDMDNIIYIIYHLVI